MRQIIEKTVFHLVSERIPANPQRSSAIHQPGGFHGMSRSATAVSTCSTFRNGWARQPLSLSAMCIILGTKAG
jgi:hypothetical protein